MEDNNNTNGNEVLEAETHAGESETDFAELRAIQAQMSETLKEINEKLKTDPEQPPARVNIEDYLKNFIPEEYRR